MLSKYFFFKDDFLVFHLVNSNIDYLHTFIKSKKNKDKARKYIIHLKYQLSSISPLVYEIINKSVDRFNDNTCEESGGWTRIKDQKYGIFLYNHLIINLYNYRIIMTINGINLLTLYDPKKTHYNPEMIILKLSRLEKRLIYFLGWYKLDNKNKIEKFKANSEYDKIINRR